MIPRVDPVVCEVSVALDSQLAPNVESEVSSAAWRHRLNEDEETYLRVCFARQLANPHLWQHYEYEKDVPTMQVFLPYADFSESARVLDWRRLGKQRVEARQILDAIEKGTRWRHHPIVKMWQPWTDAIRLYFNAVSMEWVSRGYNHNMGFYKVDAFRTELPCWLGREDIHRAYQSNLVRKNPDHYRTYFPDVPDDLPYVWVLPEPAIYAVE